mmetsp:Transcript_32053/g.54784  ORF Transcript_32053/g.54784 Transcript_32053/m.54784 type:complete len:224 (-) Transcript_32053:1287-1958(-)
MRSAWKWSISTLCTASGAVDKTSSSVGWPVLDTCGCSLASCFLMCTASWPGAFSGGMALLLLAGMRFMSSRISFSSCPQVTMKAQSPERLFSAVSATFARFLYSSRSSISLPTGPTGNDLNLSRFCSRRCIRSGKSSCRQLSLSLESFFSRVSSLVASFFACSAWPTWSRKMIIASSCFLYARTASSTSSCASASALRASSSRLSRLCFFFCSAAFCALSLAS